MLLVMDDYSWYITSTPLKSKSEAGKALMDTINQLESVVEQKVSQVQVDWGGEFRSLALDSEFKRKGIIQKETVPVMDMKARTMSLAHGRVMKMTFEPLKGQYRHSPRGECQQSEEQPQTSISHHSPWGECQYSNINCPGAKKWPKAENQLLPRGGSQWLML